MLTYMCALQVSDEAEDSAAAYAECYYRGMYLYQPTNQPPTGRPLLQVVRRNLSTYLPMLHYAMSPLANLTAFVPRAGASHRDAQMHRSNGQPDCDFRAKKCG